MFTRRRVLFVAFGICAALLVALVFFKLQEPSYRGKPLSYWLEKLGHDYGRYYGSAALAQAHLAPLSETNEAVVAVRSIGTVALPLLIERMQTHDSRWDSWRRKINEKQSLIRLTLGKEERKRVEAQIALIALGDAAKPAIPELTQLLGDWTIPRDSAAVLRNLGNDGAIALTNAFTNRGDFAWYLAAEALRFQGSMWGDPAGDPRVAKYRSERSCALPHLANLVRHTNYLVVRPAVMALGDIGGRSAIVTNTLNAVAADESADQRSREVARARLRRLAETNIIKLHWTNPDSF